MLFCLFTGLLSFSKDVFTSWLSVSWSRRCLLDRTTSLLGCCCWLLNESFFSSWKASVIKDTSQETSLAQQKRKMPFIGLDWRSPGESWIKTHNGSWERLKILENSPGSSGAADSSSFSSGCSSLSSSPLALSYMPHRCRDSLSESDSISSKENSPPPVSSSSSDVSSSSLDLSGNALEVLMEREPSPSPAGDTQLAAYQPYCRIYNKPTREVRV